MVAAIAITPASGDVRAVISACRVDVTGLEPNDPATYNVDNIPTEDEVRYRLIATLTGQDDLVSHDFAASAGLTHTWDNIIFPADGGWTLDLVDQRDDSVEATLAVTVTT